MPQYIRRDRSALHFGRRRRGINWPLLLFWLAGMIFVGFVILRYDQIQADIVALVAGPPTPTPSAPAMANTAYEAYLAGDVLAAEAAFAEAVRMDPANIDYLYEYGRMLLYNDKDEEGLAVAQQAIEAAPDDPRGYVLDVLALYQQGRLEEAIPMGLAALEIDPDYAPIYAALAWAYTDIGRWAQGLEMGGRAVQLDPNSIDARRAFAYSLAYTGQPQLAARQLESAVAVHPNLDFLYFELAGSYRALDNQAAALGAYERVLENNPDNVRAMVRMCETYFNLRQDRLAQGYCEDALEIDENFAPVWEQLGMIYFTRRNYESAIEAFERCVDLGSEAIQCWYVRGLAHYYLDQCDLAVPILQEAFQQVEAEEIRAIVVEGLRLCAFVDPAYDESIIPTPAPTPTFVPTPIGVF